MIDPLGDLDVDQLRRRTTSKWSDHGDDVIPAWVADADAPVCPPVRSAIDALLDRGDLTYPSDAAPIGLRAAFASRMGQRYGWHPDADRTLVFTDVVQGASFAIDRLTAAGDGVMVHTPVFPPFRDEIDAAGRRLVPLPWERSGDGWATDPAAVTRGADDGARLLILVNPHNPTGLAWTRADLEALAEVVIERDLIVFADEIYGELTLDDRPHVPFASLGADVEARTVTMTSVAKSHNLAGVRCAVAHVGASAHLEPLRSVPPSQLGQVSNIGFAATIAAWHDGNDWLAGYVESITERRDRFAAALAEHLPGADHVPPEATFLAWVDLRPLDLPGVPADFFLERARVALGGGEEYGPGGDGRVRVNLATSTAILDEVIERMVTAIDIWQASGVGASS